MPLVFLLMLSLISQSQAQELDQDGDGLSDFQEIHKYLTDPTKADSDGDGIPDGDWLERREYQYTVRTIVQVMRPVTAEFLNDDYQDIRVLDETETYLELEVIHYPFNTVEESIEADPNWRKTTSRMKAWLQSGLTSDWDEQLKQELSAALKKEGHDIDQFSDREMVETVAAWLLNNSKYEDSFFTFVVGFNADRLPYLPEAVKEPKTKQLKKLGRSLEEQFEREMSSKGMFQHRQHGSCTSSAIFMNGCLRAMGIPTRIVLCIPCIDASDPEERRLLEQGLSHHVLRDELGSSAEALSQSWASHTFNEVYVGGRWRRLNYKKLGQNILDQGALGLMTHVATLSDWSDGQTWKTIGPRQTNSDQNDVFGHRNPYSCISLRDQFGAHCKIANDKPVKASPKMVALSWYDSDELPAHIRRGLDRSGRRGLCLKAEGFPSWKETVAFLKGENLRVDLVAEGYPSLELRLDKGCVWGLDGGDAYISLPLDAESRTKLKSGVEYRALPARSKEDAGWSVEETTARITAR